MTFQEEIRALIFEYNDNIKKLKDESTFELFSYILKNPSNQVRATNIKNIQIGKFYVIKYDFNGNKLWCPILTIPPILTKNEEGILDKSIKIVNSKNILYALNFDYLPLEYKILLIDVIIKSNINRYETNQNKISVGESVKEELNFKVNWMYDFLKRNGKKNYAITAYDISKIINVFEISSTILQRFIFLDTYYINNKLMYETLNNVANEKLRLEFSNKIKIFEEIIQMYEKDVENFYKTLRNFEKNLKLIEEL